MKDRLRFGIVGCGVISATHALCIEELPGAELAALCDIRPERAQALAERFPAQVYPDVESMLRLAEVDVVCVTTPSGLHADVGVAAARAGKHVIVEKPIDVSLDKADALIRACREAGVKLSCISQHRFDPAVIALRKAVDENLLGRLNFGGSHTKWYRAQDYYDHSDWHGTWALDGGGALINQSIHYVDLLRYIMGPVAEIHAYCATCAHENIEVEDLAVASLKFQSGALGLLEGSTSAYPGFCARLDIYGTEGSVIIENDQIKEWHLRCGQACPVEEEPVGFIGGSSSKNIWHHSHRRQIEDVIDSILEDRAPLVTGEEGRTALEIVLAVYQSSRIGETVRLAS